MRYDVAVVGAGPAGVAAACAASECGASVALLDDNPAPGGQIWRGMRTPWLGRLQNSEVTILSGTQVFDKPHIDYGKLILATGARERFLPFPGWTLPHVMGAGGLQALVKGGMPIAGKRVVVAGTGPLLLAVAAYLRNQGAGIVLVAEQAPWHRLLKFGLALLRQPSKIAQAARLRPPRYITDCWPIKAEPGVVVLRATDGQWRETCDYLACGFGLVPNLELPLLLGCRLARKGPQLRFACDYLGDDGFVEVDQWQQTSVPGVYGAGELTGIGGLDLALAGGQIAGYAAAGHPEKARLHFEERQRALSFQALMDKTFALRDELRSLPAPDTILCRCEDVLWSAVAAQPSWRDAKLQTRCGMGPCQGRVCGPALEFLRGWKPQSVRPPVFPVPLGQLIDAAAPLPADGAQRSPTAGGQSTD